MPTLTARCRVCGRTCRWVARRYAWVHTTAQDHPPIPDRQGEPPTCGGSTTPPGTSPARKPGGMTPGGDAVRQHDGTAEAYPVQDYDGSDAVARQHASTEDPK